ncbi:peptidoglycan-binding domain-containing protein [Streptomyces violaceus]
MAKTSDGWVRGYDKYQDDWDDEGVLSERSDYKTSNATCMWQRILWAEGVYWDVDSRFSESDITGEFGAKTGQGTSGLQQRWDLTHDRTVGNATFGRAADNLKKTGGSTGRGETLYLKYYGGRYNISFKRNTEGKYLFRDQNGDWRQAGYDYRTCAH